jgi:mono/diheme cytochrome c family protein
MSVYGDGKSRERARARVGELLGAVQNRSLSRNMEEFRSSASNIVESLVPSSRLLTAAVSGLLALSVGACDEESTKDEPEHEHDAQLNSEEIEAMCKQEVDKALDKAGSTQDAKALCSSMVSDTEKACGDKVDAAKKEAADACKSGDSDLPKLCKDMVDSAQADLKKSESDLKAEVKKLRDEITALKEKARPLLLTTEEKTITAEQKEYTFAELTTMCDKRGGYTQVHAACGGHNACAGFSYGDWGPGAAMLTEHSCTGVNGCLGLSCVDLPKDAGRTGKQLYEEVEFPEPFNNCGGCHGGYYDDKHEWQKDPSYFAVYVFEGSTRTAENWLDRSAAEQERVTAFGARTVLPGGTAIQNMAEYHSVLSRAETERVVAHIRTLKASMVTIKTADKK